ncbi:MAG: ETX/MTX2 family pore-forming toxin, partial [Pseudomonadota bacterium]|nr:ETX/MTX2 family pore-forming toxin [Pseudomonadota bacterium]
MTYETTKFPSSRKAMLVGASAMIALGAAWASPSHAAEFQPGDDIKITYSKITEGAGGNAWIKEDPAIVNRGVISRVEVCGGRYIDGITFFYKGRRGTKFGGNGGNCESFYVPKEQFINEVIVWRGDWINAIQFVTTDGEGGRSESKVYGDPAGAARVPVQAPDGGSLRMVHGKGGAYVNQLELAFGLPYYISDIDIRFDKPLKEIVASDPKQIDVVHGDNCGNSRGSLEMENAFSKSVTESHNFTFSNTTGFELSTEVNVGLPVLAEGKIGISASSEFTFEKSEGAETTETVSRGYKYSVPPGRRIDGAYVARTADVELPFTYNLYHYRNGNRDDHLKPS